MINPHGWFQRKLQTLPRHEPRCPYVGNCGGCSLQSAAYEDQIALKAEWVREQLAAVGYEREVPIVALEDPWRYRGKAELSFGLDEGTLVLGYHAAGSFTRVVDVEDCFLLPEAVVPVVRELLDAARASGLPPYYARRHEGVLRHVIVRYSELEQRMLLGVVTTAQGRDFAEAVSADLMRRFPSVKGFLWGLNESRSDAVSIDQFTLIRGSNRLRAKIGAFVVEHHLLSFLQSSAVQADRIYRFVRDALPAASQDSAWDVYCGLGLLGFYLAEKYRSVYGIEIEEPTLELARQNARELGIGAMHFRSGPAEDVFMDRNYWLGEARPRVVAVDPPRAGLSPRVIATLLASRPEAIAYVSCNAQSLVRDLKLLLNAYPKYMLTDVRAFDMFPQTHHVETVAILQKQGIGNS